MTRKRGAMTAMAQRMQNGRHRAALRTCASARTRESAGMGTRFIGPQFTLMGPLPVMLLSMICAATLTRIVTARRTRPSSKRELR